MLTPRLWGSWCVGILVPSEDGALGRGASRSRRLSAFRCRLHQSRVVRARVRVCVRVCVRAQAGWPGRDV